MQKYLPCTCGCTTADARFQRGLGEDGYYFRTCPKCNYTVRFHKDELRWPNGSWETKMKITWNESIRNQESELDEEYSLVHYEESDENELSSEE